MPEGVTLSNLDPFVGVTVLSASLERGSGPAFNWNVIGRKYWEKLKRRWVPGFEGGCPLRAGWGVRPVNLPAGLFPVFCTSLARWVSTGIATIPLHAIVGRPKTDDPKTGLLSTSCVYSIPCSCGKIYKGETGRLLKSKARRTSEGNSTRGDWKVGYGGPYMEGKWKSSALMG